MNFSDRWATDEKGEQFLFTVEMQRRLHEAGLPVEPEEIAKFKAKHAPKAAPNPNARKPRERAPRPERPVVEEPTEIEVDEATGKFIGTLESFNKGKGFGFILRGAGEKLFFHKSKALDDPGSMSPGQKVLYEINLYRGKEEGVNVEEFEE